MEDEQSMDMEKTLDESKKVYEKPELKLHGDLREITKQGGGLSWDVPVGDIDANVDSPIDMTS